MSYYNMSEIITYCSCLCLYKEVRRRLSTYMGTLFNFDANRTKVIGSEIPARDLYTTRLVFSLSNCVIAAIQTPCHGNGTHAGCPVIYKHVIILFTYTHPSPSADVSRLIYPPCRRAITETFIWFTIEKCRRSNRSNTIFWCVAFIRSCAVFHDPVTVHKLSRAGDTTLQNSNWLPWLYYILAGLYRW